MCNYETLEELNKIPIETIQEELAKNVQLVKEYLGDGHIREDFFFNEHGRVYPQFCVNPKSGSKMII